MRALRFNEFGDPAVLQARRRLRLPRRVVFRQARLQHWGGLDQAPEGPAHDQRAFADMAELPNVTTKGLIL
jgi:hypothetical protein